VVVAQVEGEGRLNEDTRAMAANSITMLAAEYTESGWAGEGLRERIASVATFADIRHDELRSLLRCGWEEGTICHLADSEGDLFGLSAQVLAAEYLGLIREEVLETDIGQRLDRVGLLSQGSDAASTA
jgi:hypothetical protein